MQRCPIPFNNKSEISFIEPFSNGGDSCPPSGGGDTSSPDYYEHRRAINIEKLGERYNQTLAQYLNAYNKELVSASINSGDPSTASSQQYKTERAKYEKILQNLQKDLEKNNEQTNLLIKQQTQDIEAKTKAIEQKNKLINSQTEYIDDKNRIMNSRERQIELGVQKNIYKRNIMYFLVFVNALVLCILLGIIYRGQ